MPIFTSWFSPERSLVGNLAATRPRENENADARENTRRSDRATSRTSQQAKTDRLDLTNQQQATLATSLVRSAEQPSETRAENSAVDSQTVRQLNLRKASQEAVVARSSLRSSPEEIPQVPPDIDNTEGTSDPLRTSLTQENFSALQSALSNRLDDLVEQLSDIRTVQSLQANRQENFDAARRAEPEPLAALAQATAESAESGTNLITDDEAVILQGEQLEARIDQLRDRRLELASNFVPVEPPAREEQQAELREDLQTISSGLQSDAVIESKRSIEETERNTEVAAGREQRQTVRANQSEIRNVQANKRRLSQEAQRADQTIRQLQSETARLKNSAPASGTALDILAQ
jgi:hypothetical protein